MLSREFLLKLFTSLLDFFFGCKFKNHCFLCPGKNKTRRGEEEKRRGARLKGKGKARLFFADPGIKSSRYFFK